jgi:carboxypeptidase Q
MRINRMSEAMLLGSALFLFAGTTLQAADPGPSIKEGREKIVRLARALERNPIVGITDNDRVWAIKFIEDDPDIEVNLGSAAASLLREGARKDQGQFMFVQFILNAAAFQIENPTKIKDLEAVDLAALEGVLRAYENLVRKYPAARDESMDEMVRLRGKGELPGLVKKLRAKK